MDFRRWNGNVVGRYIANLISGKPDEDRPGKNLTFILQAALKPLSQVPITLLT